MNELFYLCLSGGILFTTFLTMYYDLSYIHSHYKLFFLLFISIVIISIAWQHEHKERHESTKPPTAREGGYYFPKQSFTNDGENDTLASDFVNFSLIGNDEFMNLIEGNVSNLISGHVRHVGDTIEFRPSLNGSLNSGNLAINYETTRYSDDYCTVKIYYRSDITVYAIGTHSKSWVKYPITTNTNLFYYVEYKVAFTEKSDNGYAVFAFKNIEGDTLLYFIRWTDYVQGDIKTDTTAYSQYT